MPILILVIDDDAAIRISLSLLLQAKGYEVALAVDGADGYAKFLERKPDILISDMVMPGHQGLETIARIHADAPGLPIVAMSGSIRGGPTSFLERASAAGASHCLEKPFEAMQLLALLEQIEDEMRGGA